MHTYKSTYIAFVCITDRIHLHTNTVPNYFRDAPIVMHGLRVTVAYSLRVRIKHVFNHRQQQRDFPEKIA